MYFRLDGETVEAKHDCCTTGGTRVLIILLNRKTGFGIPGEIKTVQKFTFRFICHSLKKLEFSGNLMEVSSHSAEKYK